MFNKELKKEVQEIKDFLYKTGISCTSYGLDESYKFKELRELGDKVNKRIYELEAKVNALMELLAVKEVQPETETKLVKGNKEVVIGKKPVKSTLGIYYW